MLIIDPIANVAERVGSPLIAGSYTGGVLAGNGKIYAAPSNIGADEIRGVLVIQPDPFHVATVVVPASSSARSWTGSALASSGRIYAIPYDASEVMIIEPLRAHDFALSGCSLCTT